MGMLILSHILEINEKVKAYGLVMISVNQNHISFADKGALC